jgi:alkylation response protein AidB-like acyl-CoA dehydrogenase
MTRLAQTADLTDVQQEILSTVRSFVDKEIIPKAQELEHADAYPTEIVEGLKELGIFGLTIPEEFGGLGESLLTYALVVEEIARGWMSVSVRCAGRSRCRSRVWGPTSPASGPRRRSRVMAPT